MNVLSNLGRVAERAGELDTALINYGHALDIATELGQSGDRGRLLQLLARLNLGIGRIPEAGRLASLAIPEFEISNDAEAILNLRFLLGDIALRSGGVRTARAHYDWASLEAHRLGDVGGEVKAQMQRAEVALVDAAAEESALKQAEEARKLIVDSGLTGQLSQVVELQGRAAAAENKFVVAERLFREARELGVNVPSDYIAASIGLARSVLRHDPKEAIAVAGDAKAMLAQWRAGISDPFVEAEVLQLSSALVEAEVAANFALFARTKDEAYVDAALLASESGRGQVLDGLRGRETGAARAATVRSEPKKRAMDALQDDELFLAFEIAEPESYAWVVSNKDTRGVTLPGRERLARMFEAAGRWFHRSGDESGVRELSTTLLAPLLNDSDAQTLFIAPDEFVHAIPFATLRNPLAPDQHIVESYKVVRVPNLEWLSLQETRSHVRLNRLFAMGDVPYSPDPASPNPFGNLRPLTFSKAEIEAIAARFSDREVRLVTGKDASTETFSEVTSGNYGVLHFATHGVVDIRFPELSGIIILDSNDLRRNALVNAREIAALRIPADLIVLSACETGRGRIVSGEGPLSLAWAFLGSGARQVVSTLWAVADQSTSRLMERFYLYLDEGAEPAEALRQAQLDLLRQSRSRHPYYWGAFVLTGV
jgi:CHAT domain-containing protein